MTVDKSGDKTQEVFRYSGLIDKMVRISAIFNKNQILIRPWGKGFGYEAELAR